MCADEKTKFTRLQPFASKLLDAWKHLRANFNPPDIVKVFTSLVFISYICTMCKCNIEQPKLRNMLRKNQNFTWPLWGTLLSTFVEQKCFMRYLTLEWFCFYFKFHTTTVIIDKRKVKILFFLKKRLLIETVVKLFACM